jgi:hypothetical protein
VHFERYIFAAYLSDIGMDEEKMESILDGMQLLSLMHNEKFIF